jgi:hypothetical protein
MDKKKTSLKSQQDPITEPVAISRMLGYLKLTQGKTD